MGFGHRVYKNYDPRAKIMQKTCHEVLHELGVNDPLFDVAMELERIALHDEYFIEKRLYPNVDFYSGITLRAMGFPTAMFTVLFALARTVGWIAQWKEMIEDPHQKLGRPRQLYTGAPRRDYQPISRRNNFPLIPAKAGIQPRSHPGPRLRGDGGIYARPFLKMAIGRAGKRERFAVVHKAGALACLHAADLGHGNTGRPGGALEFRQLVRRQRQYDLVVVAAGEHRFAQRRCGGHRRASGIGKRHTHNIDVGRDRRGAAELGEVAGKPVRHVDRRRRVLQNRRGERIARLRQQIALL